MHVTHSIVLCYYGNDHIYEILLRKSKFLKFFKLFDCIFILMSCVNKYIVTNLGDENWLWIRNYNLI